MASAAGGLPHSSWRLCVCVGVCVGEGGVLRVASDAGVLRGACASCNGAKAQGVHPRAAASKACCATHLHLHRCHAQLRRPKVLQDLLQRIARHLELPGVARGLQHAHELQHELHQEGLGGVGEGPGAAQLRLHARWVQRAQQPQALRTPAAAQRRQQQPQQHAPSGLQHGRPLRSWWQAATGVPACCEAAPETHCWRRSTLARLTSASWTPPARHVQGSRSSPAAQT
jgi:hypothetical protein